MPIDFSPLQQIDPAGAFFRGQEAAQARADQNMLRQMQAEKQQFERENMLAQRGEREALAAERRRATEQQNALAEYVRSGMPQGATGLAQFGKAGLDIAEGLRKERMGVLDEERKKLEYVTQRLASATPETYGAIRADLGRFSPEFVNALPAEYNGEQIGSIVRQGLALKDQLDLFKPMTVAPGASVFDPRTRQQMFTAPVAPRASQLLTPEEEAQKTRIALASRPPPQPREPREPPAPIPVVDPATGQVKYVPRDQAVGMTPPQFMESLTPKERQSREAKFPQATSAVKTFETTSNTLIKDLETLAKHPGLSSITGIAAGRLPGITSAGREAEALFDKISARGGFQELQNMRQASPTGGALGNVSNKEGEQLRQAFAALDRRQDAASVRKAITDAINQIRASQQTIKDAYDMTYEYKQGAGAPSAAPAATKSGATVSNW
jgi:hypothetical protein